MEQSEEPSTSTGAFIDDYEQSEKPSTSTGAVVDDYEQMCRLVDKTYQAGIIEGSWQWHDDPVDSSFDIDEDDSLFSQDDSLFSQDDSSLGHDEDIPMMDIEDVVAEDVGEALGDDEPKKDDRTPRDVAFYDDRENTLENEIFGESAKPCCIRNCNKKIPKDMARHTRQSFQELAKMEQDLVLLGTIQSHRRHPQLKNEYDEETLRGSSRIRSSTEDTYRKGLRYYYHDVLICRNLFSYIYDIGKKRFRNLIEHFDSKGLRDRVHGSIGRMSTNVTAITLEQRKQVINFIQSYSEKNAIPLPGRLPNFKDFRVVKLPPKDSKASIHRLYQKAVVAMAAKAEAQAGSSTASETPFREIGFNAFVNIWNAHLPYITTTKPAYDLCDTCRTNTLAIVRATNCGEDQKESLMKEAEQHLNDARGQREYYNECRELCQKQQKINIDGIEGEHDFKVLSFDFAESVHYPTSARQVGSEYFASTRKCFAFGVHDERSGIQHNFLIDEADSIGKGANVVISMLHSYLEQHNTDVLILWADNCIGQNKNNSMMQYLQWRVNSNKNLHITLNFMIPGHTKFSPDRGFGCWKYAYRRATIDSLADLITMINDLPGRFNVAVPTIFNNERNVVWYDWSSYLSTYFRTFPGLTGFQRFVFRRDIAMRVSRMCFDSTYKSVALETAELGIESLILEEIIPEPMSNARQWYLFTIVRNLVDDETKKDDVCPKPLVPRPRAKKGESLDFSKQKIQEPKKRSKSESTEKKEQPKRKRDVAPKPLVPRPRATKGESEPSTAKEEKPKRKRGRPKKAEF